jgi:pilus assembly protein CpaD
MSRHIHPVALALLPLVAGCVPGVAEYTKTEAPAGLRVDGAISTATFAFAPGSARLSTGEALRLDRLVADGAIRAADRVEIAAAGPPALSAARSAAVSGTLLRWGIVADAHPLAGVPRNSAIVTVGHYAVTLPACPNWSQAATYDFGQSVPSWYGCDDATNLGLMAASPGDLVAGRSLAATDGEPAAAAVSRYLEDKVPALPAEANMGPITAGAESGAPGGSGGPSGAGGQ